MKLSRNFDLSEFTRSDTAIRKGIKNEPTLEAIACLTSLVTMLLQPLRNLYGKPMPVSSGYRSPDVNAAVGGVPTTQHVKGQAADIAVIDPRNLLGVLLASSLVFDQAILYDDGRNNFLHLSYNPILVNNRKQVLYSKGTSV